MLTTVLPPTEFSIKLDLWCVDIPVLPEAAELWLMLYFLFAFYAPMAPAVGLELQL